MSGNLNNRDKAILAWGVDAPVWVLMLADACDRTNQRLVGDKLGRNSGWVSRIINRSYGASYAEPEQIVRAAYGGEQVMCPLYGPIELKTCLRFRRRKGLPRNPMHIDHDRACPECPNNTDRPVDQED